MSLRSLAARPAAVRRPSSHPDPPLPPRVRSRCPAARLPAWTAVPAVASAPARWRCSRPPSSRCRHSPLRNPVPQARCHRKARDDWRVRRLPSIRAMAPCRRSRCLRDTAVGAGRQARGGARTSGGTAVGLGGATGCRSAAAEADRAFAAFTGAGERGRVRAGRRGCCGTNAATWNGPGGRGSSAHRGDASGCAQRGRRGSSGRALPGTGHAARRNPADRGAPERDRHRPRPAARLGRLRPRGRGGARRLPRRSAGRRHADRG